MGCQCRALCFRSCGSGVSQYVSRRVQEETSSDYSLLEKSLLLCGSLGMRYQRNGHIPFGSSVYYFQHCAGRVGARQPPAHMEGEFFKRWSLSVGSSTPETQSSAGHKHSPSARWVPRGSTNNRYSDKRMKTANLGFSPRMYVSSGRNCCGLLKTTRFLSVQN